MQKTVGETSDFECLKCGACCRKLLQTTDGVTRGPPLSEKEANLFPPEVISPKLAVGLVEPKTVVLYQLNVGVCPYINQKNECQKYVDRPLICRSFPIVAGAISNRCKVFAYRKVGVSYCEPFPMAKQLEASEKLDGYTLNRIRKHFKKGLKAWEYDLATKKWIYKTQYDTPP